MNPTAPPVKRGSDGSETGRYFFITRSTTSRPSRTIWGALAAALDWRAVGHGRIPRLGRIFSERQSVNAGRARVRNFRRGRVGNHEFLDDLAVFDEFDAVADLPDDGARIAADERIAAQMFAALDRLEQERFALPANFVIGGERRFKIGEQSGA